MIPRRAAFRAALLASIGAAASSASALTIEEAVAAAVQNNASLARSAIAVAADKRSADAARNLLYPDLSVGAGVSRSGAGAVEAERYAAYGSVSLSLSLAPSMRTKMSRRTLVYELSALDYESSLRSLELDVRKAFYGLLLDEANLELAGQNLERERKSSEQVKVSYNAGLVPELDFLSAQVSLVSLQQKQDAAKVTLEDALDSFRLLLGLEPGSALDVEGSLGSARSITAETLARGLAAPGAGSLSIASAQKSLEIAKVDRRLAVAAVAAPSLSLSAKVAPTLAYESAKAGLGLSDSGSVSLGLSLPLDGLLPDSAAKIALAEADDSVASMESKLAEAQRGSRSSIATLKRAIETTVSSLTALTSSVELAQKKYDLTCAAYSKGLKDISDVETAAGTLDSAKADVIAEEYTLVSKALELENELGLAFGTIGR